MKKFLLGIVVVFVMNSCATYYGGYVASSDVHVLNRTYNVVGDVSFIGEKSGEILKVKGAHFVLLEEAKRKYGDNNVDDVVSIQATQFAYVDPFVFLVRGLVFEGKAIKYTD